VAPRGGSALAVEYLPLSGLRPAARNPKAHDVEALVASLGRFGFVAPVIIDDRTGRLVAGHGRVEALERAKAAGADPPARVKVEGGEWLVPVVRGVSFARDVDAEAYLLADNQLTAGPGWGDGIDAMLRELRDADALVGTGFTEADLRKLLGRGDADDPSDEVDRAAELAEKWGTARGQLWTAGAHRLLCADARDSAAIATLMDGDRPAMVYTDPPYGMDLDTDFSGMVGLARGNSYDRVRGDAEPYDPGHLFAEFGDCPEIILWGADYYAERIPKRIDGSWFVWDKAAGGDAPNDEYDKMFGSNFELAWSRTRHKRALVRVLWKGIFGLASADTKRRVHPTQKPAELARWFLERFSEPGAIVVDTFLGSGSTAVAAEQLGRRCYAMEIEPKYVAVTLERLASMGLRSERLA